MVGQAKLGQLEKADEQDLYCWSSSRCLTLGLAPDAIDDGGRAAADSALYDEDMEYWTSTANGIRGLASFMVVTGHLHTAFAPYLHSPAPAEGKPPYLFQLPILRLVLGGRLAVALFFIITGYVTALGRIREARLGKHEKAFGSISRSLLSRAGKLALPTMTATVISWFIATLSGYRLIETVDSDWIRQGFWAPNDTWSGALWELCRFLIETWSENWNPFDGTQWTIALFLKGSLTVHIILVATMFVTPSARRMVIAVIYFYGWARYKDTYGATMTMNIAAGMMVAELDVAMQLQHSRAGYNQDYIIVPEFVSYLLAIFGCFIASYPQDNAHWTGWSKWMEKFMLALTPHDQTDVRRHWDSLGAVIIFVAIFLSSSMRRVFTSKVFNFLGRISFPVYLIHNTLIKTMLSWMVYLPGSLVPGIPLWGGPHEEVKPSRPPRPESGRMPVPELHRPSSVYMGLSIALYYYFLYELALVWKSTVDVWADRVVERATRWAMAGENNADVQPSSQYESVQEVRVRPKSDRGMV